MRLRRGPAFLLVCLLGCSSSPRTSDSAAENAKAGPSEVEAEAEAEPEAKPGSGTPCKEDGDCRLSCIEANNCCGEPPFCMKARHWDDHQAIEATRTNCQNFDYTTCTPNDHTQPPEVAIPVCKRKRCMVEFIKREPPPVAIDLSGYDRSCSKDEDCGLVHNQPCAKCGCANEPINAKELDRARQAIAAVKCPPYDPWPNINCGACMPLEAYCEAGRCQGR